MAASFVTSSAVGSSGTTHNCTIPATAQVGDLLVVVVRKTSTLSSFGALPAGWATAAPVQSLSGAGTSFMGYKVCQAGDPGGTFTITTSATRDVAITIGVWRPVTATPLVAAGASGAANTTSHAQASGLAPTGPAIAIMAMTFNGGVEDFTPPVGYAEIMENGAIGFTLAWLEVPAGAIGTLTYTSAASKTAIRHICAFYVQPTTQTVGLGQASETDTAHALKPSKRAALGQAQETDTAHATTASKRALAAQGTETDTALPLSPVKRLTLGQAEEADTAHSLAASKRAQAGSAEEADAALPFSPLKRAEAGLAASSDEALPFHPVKRVTLGTAQETDTAGGLTPPFSGIGQALEVDTALPLTPAKRRELGLAAETDEALPLTPAKAATAAAALEADEALGFRAIKRVTLGTAIDVQEARSLTPAHVLIFGTALEVDEALAFAVDQFFAERGYPGFVAGDRGGSLAGVLEGRLTKPVVGSAR